MNLEAISGAAVVALTSTVVFVLIAKTWLSLTRSTVSAQNFSDRILHESAQRFRDELSRLSGSQAAYLAGALAFILLFTAAYFLDAQRLFTGYPVWQLYLQLAFLSCAATFAFYRLVRTSLDRRRIQFARDANIAIDHQLQQLAAGMRRVYHDVPTTAGIVDHVIVGQDGIYAVNVIAIRSRKRGDARLENNAIAFSTQKDPRSIVKISAKAVRLEKELATLLGTQIRVRSVIAVPGWDISEQRSESQLLVNERTIAMISGWKDSSDHLMNDDVDALQRELTSRCSAG